MEALNSLSKEELIELVLQLRTIVKEQADTLQRFAKRVEELQQEIATLKSVRAGKRKK